MYIDMYMPIDPLLCMHKQAMFILSKSLLNAVYIKAVIIFVQKEEKYINFVNKAPLVCVEVRWIICIFV